MTLQRAIYSSQPLHYTQDLLNSILVEAREANRRDDITGALICRDDVFLQWLEGPAPAVHAVLDRIRHDRRHRNMHMHVDEPVPERIFSQWSMLDDPTPTWFWSRNEIAGGILERVPPEEVTAFFLRLLSAAPRQVRAALRDRLKARSGFRR